MKNWLRTALAAAIFIVAPTAGKTASQDLAAGAASLALQPPPPAAGHGLEIYVFRVGQADSMLIVGPGPERRTLLVDLGVSRYSPHAGSETARRVGQRITAITGRQHIDYFLLSHFHIDHYGRSVPFPPNSRSASTAGIVYLVENLGFTIGTVIDTGSLGTDVVDRGADATDYLRRLASWEASGRIRERVLPQFGTGQVRLGAGVAVDILAFGGRYADNLPSVHEQYGRSRPGRSLRRRSENDLSIAFELSRGNFEFWSGGDLSGADGDGTAPISGSSYTNVETPMVAHWESINRESDVEIYRVNHHGARYSTTPQLLGALDPEHVIYSAERGHGHPSPEVVERVGRTARQIATDVDPGVWDDDRPFRRRGREILGEIEILVSADGSTYTINHQRFRSYSDVEERSNLDARSR